MGIPYGIPFGHDIKGSRSRIYIYAHFNKYDKILLMGNFNSSADDSHIKSFCKTYELKSVVGGPTCFENPRNPSCIDPILSNRSLSFYKSEVIEPGLSDSHKIITTVMRMHFPKAYFIISNL